MRKEQLVAVILGSLLGISGAFLVWRGSRMRPTPSVSSPKVDTSDANQIVADLSLVSPLDGTVSTEDLIDISGLSVPGSVIAARNKNIVVTKANSSGEFELQVELISGINDIKVWAFELGHEPREKNLRIVFTTKLDTKEASEPVVAVMGSITDITADTIQTRSDNGEIEQISISPGTTYGSVVDDPKEITFSDLAIGDLIASIGQRQGGKVLNASRILVTTRTEADNLEVKSGTIKTLSSSQFLVEEAATGQEVSIEAKGKVGVYNAKETEIKTDKLMNAEEGDSIVVFGKIDKDELIASTIILL